MNLDQFYTAPAVAAECLTLLRRRVPTADAYFIEPAAGDGAFYRCLKALPNPCTGLDLEPRCPGVMQRDFLDWRPRRGSKAGRIVVGNPPFGKRGRLALGFITHAAIFADTVAFILPMCFTKHLTQKHIPADMKLIASRVLPVDSFRLLDGKPYKVNTVFQIWTRLDGCGEDMRIRRAPPTYHRDFIMHQYNNTRQAEKYFAEDFDFAVPCQGWQDYTRKETNPAHCERNIQWMLIKPLSDAARKVLHDGIDYHALAHRDATTVPGYRKHDLVSEYSVSASADGRGNWAISLPEKPSTSVID